MSVSKETKETITATAAATAAKTADEIFSKMSKVSWIDRQKAMTEARYKNTEKLLYSFNALGEHLKNENEYFNMAFKKKSGSVVRYSKNKVDVNEDQVLNDRQDSYNRSLSDYKRVQNALDKMKDRKGYVIIDMYYLQRKDVVSDERYTIADLVDKLAGTQGYSENLNEKTVRIQKSRLIKEISILLFGSDAI